MDGDRHPGGYVARGGVLLVSEGELPVPEGLDWLRGLPGGEVWLLQLPALVAGSVRDWRLTVHAPVEHSGVSWVAPAELADGTRAVLKLGFPDEESELEASALRLWAGRGAVRLYRYDYARRAMLLQRCEPGVQLWDVKDDDAANRIAASVLRRLWRPSPGNVPFRSLSALAERWRRELPARYERHGAPFGRELLDQTLCWCTELAASQAQLIVCHQDFHGGNVLSAGTGWLAIDPKPLVGERAFDVASLLRDRRDWLLNCRRPAEIVRRRLDLLSAELGLERERMRGWGIVHALAWGLTDEGVYPANIACAELLAQC